MLIKMSRSLSRGREYFLYQEGHNETIRVYLLPCLVKEIPDHWMYYIREDARKKQEFIFTVSGKGSSPLNTRSLDVACNIKRGHKEATRVIFYHVW
jgi:hypothetical protein